MKRSDIVGLHRIKNKVSRNAFDLSHRHMFTAQVGELLPIFNTWVNPGDTLKLGYNGFSRTAPLQTAAFTRLKENVQYYFVPFQALWKYFEQVVNNMPQGQSGENISRIAANASLEEKLGTKLPCISYVDLCKLVISQLDQCKKRLLAFYLKSNANGPTLISHNAYLRDLESASLVRNQTLRYASICKLLNYLGYGNFPLMSYDVVSSWISYTNSLSTPLDASVERFDASPYGYVDNISHTHSPNLSVLPLLAYHKIVNDHYRYSQWQPFEPWTCNIDYITPASNMDYASRFPNFSFTSATTTFDMEYSNLPLDYFTGVLPRAQYGDESSAVVDSPKTTLSDFAGWSALDTGADFPKGATVETSADANCLSVSGGSQIGHTHGLQSSSLKVSALRSAIALQKYKEVQNSNDSDFASQVLAHFGVKPHSDSRTSRFIGGSDSVIDINPQVNQNLTGDNQAEIKAIATGDLSAGCKFTADTYGIVIGIYRCVPQLDIAHSGIDRQLLKTDSSDFVIPELDSIGMQTQYKFELFAPPAGHSKFDLSFGDTYSADLSATYGYAPRYCEYKVSYDRVDGAFNSVLSSWVVGYNNELLNTWLKPSSGFWSPTDFNRLLVCSPAICYPIFQEQTSACIANDKIFVGSVNTCVAVRNLSVHGLPYTK